MRLFTVEILNEYISGTEGVITDASMRELLGRADILILEVFVGKSDGTSPTLTVKVNHSNSGRNFNVHSTPISAADVSSPPYTNMVAVGSESSPLGGLVEVVAMLGGTNPEGFVRIVATGRSW